MKNKENKSFVSKSIVNVFSGSIFSRVTGALREMIMAFYFGADPLVAAFWIAVRMIFFLRKILGGQVLGIVFIPHFEFLRSFDENRAAFFFRRFCKFFILASCLFTICLEIGLLGIYCYYPDYAGHVLKLTMITLPAGIFLLLYTVNAALLHCENKFLGVGLAPSLVNIIWIGTVIFFRNYTVTFRIYLLAYVLVIGFFLEWLVTVPGVYAYLKNWKIHPEERDSIKTLITPMSLGLLSSAVLQINTMADLFIARYICDTGPLYLWYASRIQQLPVHLFGLGVFTVILPKLSQHIQSGNKALGYRILKFALHLTLSIMIVMTIGLFLLTVPGVRLIYEHGQFSQEAVFYIVNVLRGYGGNIIPTALSFVVSVLFYAKKQYKKPLVIGIITALSNIVMSLVLGKLFLNVTGVSIATSIVAWGQLFLLWHYAIKENPSYVGLMRKTFESCYKVFWITFISALATISFNMVTKTLFVIRMVPFSLSLFRLESNVLTQMVVFFGEAGIFLAFLFSFAKLFGVSSILHMLTKRYWSSDLNEVSRPDLELL